MKVNPVVKCGYDGSSIISSLDSFYISARVNFATYIIPMYMELLYLKHIKNLLSQNLKSDEFLHCFQKENFSLLTSYILMLHDTIILKICRITDDDKYKDDQNMKAFLKKITCCETNDDYKIVSGIYTKYKDVRNKKLAHSTNVNFTENVGCRKEKGNIFREIKHKDLYHFDELEKDIKQIGNIVQKYANLLDVKMTSIDEQLKKNHVDLPKITSEYIKEKSLFSPLL